MDLFQLLLGFVLLFVVLFLYQRFTEPTFKDRLVKMTRAIEDFSELLGKQLVPAFNKATEAANHLFRTIEGTHADK